MSRADRLEEFIHVRGGSAKLGVILTEGESCFKYKLTQSVSELREKLKARNMTIICEQNHSHPSDNEYKIVPIVPEVDGNGQAMFGFKGA